MEKKEYWWIETADGAELWARPYSDDEKIVYVVQDSEDKDWWHYTCDYFHLGSDSFIASDLVGAKGCLLDIIQSTIDDQIEYYNHMMQIFG